MIQPWTAAEDCLQANCIVLMLTKAHPARQHVRSGKCGFRKVVCNCDTLLVVLQVLLWMYQYSTFEICDAFEGRFSEVVVPRFHRRRNGASRAVRSGLGMPEWPSRASHIEGIDPCNVKHTTNNSSSVSLPSRRIRRAGGGGRRRGIMTREGHCNTASIELTAVERPLL